MGKVSPLGFLAAAVLVGVTIEVVEQQSKQAAYTLVVILLLGIITFNAKAFYQQISVLMATFNAPAAPAKGK